MSVAARVYFNAHLDAGHTYRLSDEAARHVQVLRMQPGMLLHVFNGLGGYFDVTIEQMDKHSFWLKCKHDRMPVGTNG